MKRRTRDPGTKYSITFVSSGSTIYGGTYHQARKVLHDAPHFVDNIILHDNVSDCYCCGKLVARIEPYTLSQLELVI